MPTDYTVSKGIFYWAGTFCVIAALSLSFSADALSATFTGYDLAIGTIGLAIVGCLLLWRNQAGAPLEKHLAFGVQVTLFWGVVLLPVARVPDWLQAFAVVCCLAALAGLGYARYRDDLVS
ncbi:hypothetical protein CLV84_1226 [Neolewinella xylanilytica]|uniref:Uncharacterized protein n=1 Tax=Neolewinella xylanilytica TaxID=1514080 RepID=A0A2S6I9U3_9BACT|nr:hypothetical protein [Neolewinella xylanilytica]PPK88261.1 hypothetical protein CLV84_1226 [Neolewinella xylanilytica]